MYLEYTSLHFKYFKIKCIKIHVYSKHDWFKKFCLDKSLSEVFGRTKLHKKGSRNIYFFYLRNLSRLSGQIYSTGLVQSNFWHKKCLLLTQYYIIDLLIGITFSRKKIYIFLDPLIFMQFYATKNFWWTVC